MCCATCVWTCKNVLDGLTLTLSDTDAENVGCVSIVCGFRMEFVMLSGGVFIQVGSWLLQR